MAVTLTAAALGAALGVDVADATRLLAVATPTVERYAPAAPSALQDEGVIRFAGWLNESPSSGARMESEGDISTSFSPAMPGGFRASGAMALLTYWRVRRAGAI